jgi:hypothetical protein
MRRSLLFGALVAALLLDCPTGALARGVMPESPAQVQAVLYGRPIPLKEVVNHHCHDLDAPVYRCFETEAERDVDALVFVDVDLTGATTSSLDALVGPLGTLSFTFALAYTAINYGGSSLLISNPTPDLSVFGWNDTISSFKSTNGGRPKWWSGANYSGTWWQWGTSAWVSYVGDDANDRFTSVKNVP